MASGTTQGPKLPNGDYRTRRNGLPRVHSMEGVHARFIQRAATVPHTSDKYRGGFRTPGSRNPRKVGRG